MLESPFELAASRFELIARRLADDLTYGSDASRFVGRGIDFAQSRPYSLGDPIRSIDWKVTARTGQVHVKEYEAPKRVAVYIVVDTSHSMVISSLRDSKQAAAVWIAGALAISAYRRRNPVSIVSGGSRELMPAPTLARSTINRWLESLRRPEQNESTRLVERIGRVQQLADRTSLLVVISDLHAPGAVASIKRFGQQHDCLVIQVADPAELGRLRAGNVRAVEAETGRDFMLTGAAGLADGASKVAGNELAEAGIDHVLIRTDEPIVPPLRRTLAMRGGGRRVAR